MVTPRTLLALVGLLTPACATTPAVPLGPNSLKF